MATTYRRQKLNKNVEEIPNPRSLRRFLEHAFKPRQFSSFRSIRGHVTGLGREFALQEDEFCSNAHTTSTYTPWSFVPLNLLHQLSHPANFYFLLITFLQLIPGLSPTSWITTFVPLSCTLLLNAIKDGHYDWNRRQSDKRTNHKKIEVLKDGTFETLIWEAVVVGDILKVKSDEEFPADMVFLCSSDSQGLAYMETTNFDGDSHLKIRNAVYQKAFRDFNMSPAIFSGLIIKCEHPNNRLYEFEGAIKLQGAGRLFLDETKFLLRGARLRSTSWVLGCVVFTGRDTKVLRNMSSVIRKVSNLEGHVNTILPIMLVLSVIVCFAIAVTGNVWMKKHNRNYYVPVESNTWPDYGVGVKGTCVRFIRFFILLHELVPISLYMSLEVVKVVQCLFVDWDLHMYSSEADRPALARTSGLLEELGQVEYVLADKTGTLTQNILAFVNCSIGGVAYGKKAKTPGAEAAAAAAAAAPTSRSVHLVAQDEVLKGNFTANSDTGRLCCQFFTHLALCHNVYPRMVDELSVKYQAASPDDAALVQEISPSFTLWFSSLYHVLAVLPFFYLGAAECGFHLEFRNAEEIHLYLEGVGLEKHTVLAVLDFTWDRKRMSVICKNQQGRLKLYCKGADSVILRRLRDPDSSIVDATVQHIEEFSRNGYRTLCIAERELSEKEFETWAGRFLTSTTSADDRQAHLAIAAETIERDMVLLGATAVEDKLQEGVAETVTQLAQAGIRIWVLTGDKTETAVTISLSCNLLADSMHLFLLPDVLGKFVGQMLRSMLEEARRHFEDRAHDSAWSHSGGSRHSDMAVVIEGHSLRVALEAANREGFLRLCQLCRTVICCRVTPVQKVQVTRLVRSYGFMVAAVGDGANDVGMIKAAQIGVGIHGRGGNAAVAASDYSIAQFRFLARLLLVHGRWSFIRKKDLALYTIYKNIVYILANFFFSFFSAYSAQSIFPELLLSTYDLLWTLLPVTAAAILERDVCHITAENNPQLYLATQIRGTYKFAADVCQWALSAIWHAIVAFFLPYFIMHQSEADGASVGIWTFGATIYTVAVVIVNVKLAVHVSSWVLIQISILCLTVFSLFAFLLLVSVFSTARDVLEDLDSVATTLFLRPTFWLLLILSPIAACLPDVAYRAFKERGSPADATILREIESGELGWVEEVKEVVGMEVVEEEEKEGVPLVAGAIARRKTWREIVSDEQFHATDHTNSVTWDGKKRSTGFHMVTRLSAPHRKPKPLHQGPTPPRRMSAKRASLALGPLDPKEGAPSGSQPKKHWKTMSQNYRLGRSGKKESLRSRLNKWSIMRRAPPPDLEAGPRKEPQKSSLRKSDTARSHLHVMIAPDALRDPLPPPKPTRKANVAPYHHERRSYAHLLIAPDEGGPDPFEEDRHKNSLQIMINQDVPENVHVSTTVSENMKILISGGSEEGSFMSSLQRVMINPKAREAEAAASVSEGHKIRGSPYHHVNKPHTNVLVSSEGRSQEARKMSSLQIMINPAVKEDAYQVTSVSANMRVLVSGGGSEEESGNVSSLQRVMVNPDAQRGGEVLRVSPNMTLLLSGGGEVEEQKKVSSLDRVMIEPGEEKVDTERAANEAAPSEHVEELAPSERVEELAGVLDPQSRTGEENITMGANNVLEKYKASIPGKRASDLSTSKAKPERRASDLPTSKELQEKRNSALKKKKRRETLA